MSTRADRPLALTPAASPSAAPARKPMATARRVTLFEREVRYRLSTAAIDILFDAARVLSEGQRKGRRYFGSTMITIELARTADRVREDCDPATARRVADLLGADARARNRARAIATAEAQAKAAARFERLDVDLSVRASGARVHLDLDVEGELVEESVR